MISLHANLRDQIHGDRNSFRHDGVVREKRCETELGRDQEECWEIERRPLFDCANHESLLYQPHQPLHIHSHFAPLGWIADKGNTNFAFFPFHHPSHVAAFPFLSFLPIHIMLLIHISVHQIIWCQFYSNHCNHTIWFRIWWTTIMGTSFYGIQWFFTDYFFFLFFTSFFVFLIQFTLNFCIHRIESKWLSQLIIFLYFSVNYNLS